MPHRYALLIAYDGTGFAGWWRQKDRRSVAGTFDAAFRRLGEPAAEPVGASRTDAGVHAVGQVAHVDLRREWPATDLLLALAHHLPSDCAVHGAARVADDWHAVHDVRAKTYRYAIDTGALVDPFHASRLAWRIPFAVDLPALSRAAAPVPGRRDWAAFRRRGDHRDDTTCRVLRCAWRRQGRHLLCTIAATGFIYRLARSLVGGMVAVARGGCSTGEWQDALAGRPSGAARQQAPALGLCLRRIAYRHPPEWCIATTGH